MQRADDDAYDNKFCEWFVGIIYRVSYKTNMEETIRNRHDMVLKYRSFELRSGKVSERNNRDGTQNSG